MALRPAAALRVAIVTFAALSSSGAPTRRAPTLDALNASNASGDAAEGLAAVDVVSRPALSLEPTVVPADAASAPSTASPHNPEVDLDRAGILAEGAAGSGEIALTFDDGPAADTTSEVLRILAAHRVHGAFFLTGARLSGTGVVAEMNRGVARAIATAGHTVGNHGLDHLLLGRDDAVWTTLQIEASARAIADATGVAPRWFRPPYGALGDQARAQLAARGDELVLWTIDAQDVRDDDGERIAARLVSQLLWAGQGVVLLHDLRPASVRALAILLDWLDRHPRDEARGTGYTVVDLPTYLAHAAARPWPFRTRQELHRFREKSRAKLGEKNGEKSREKIRAPLRGKTSLAAAKA